MQIRVPGTRETFKVTKVIKMNWMKKIEIKSGFPHFVKVEVKLPKIIVISFIERFTNPVV